MFPIPSHLRSIFIPADERISEGLLIGIIQCPCGSNEFQLVYPGQTIEFQEKKLPCDIEIGGHCYFVIKLECCKCRAQHLLFDADFHGWDGVMCHDVEKASLPRPPLIQWRCLSCGALPHKVAVKIALESKENFVEQAGGEFADDRWPDAFQWIWITITCCNCGLETRDWVDYETE